MSSISNLSSAQISIRIVDDVRNECVMTDGVCAKPEHLLADDFLFTDTLRG